MNHHVRLVERTEARDVVRPELVGAHAGTPLDIARAVHEMWFTAMEILVRRDRIVVLDDVVVGRPDPHLLEVAYWHRRFSRDEFQAYLDDEEADHRDDDTYVRPEVDELVESMMRHQQDADRIVESHGLAALIRPWRLGWSGVDLWHLVLLEGELQRFVADVADFVRIRDAAVIDVRRGSTPARDLLRVAA